VATQLKAINVRPLDRSSASMELKCIFMFGRRNERQKNNASATLASSISRRIDKMALAVAAEHFSRQ
jgi:hypothetical protein